jgi:uncharacterized protein YkwD
MRFLSVGLLGGLLLAGAPASAETAFEQQVLVALNAARTDPAGLTRDLRDYRTSFDGRLVHFPGRAAAMITHEGVKAVDEAIAFLDRQPPLAPVETSALLTASARDLAADQAHGGVGHQASDGTWPNDRLRRHGGGGTISEVVSYGAVDARDVVRQLIVDDGERERGHRHILYAPDLRFAGVACGPHPQYRTMRVIDLSITPDGGYPKR